MEHGGSCHLVMTTSIKTTAGSRHQSVAWVHEKLAIRWFDSVFIPISTLSLQEQIQVDVPHFYAILFPVGE